MRRRNTLGGALLILLATGPLAAQQTPIAGGVRQVVEVRAVDLDVVATKDGRPVEDLTKEEIGIRLDGKPLPLDYFARVAQGTLHGPDLATASPDLILETLRTDGGARYVPREFLVFFDDAHLLPAERNAVIEGLRDFVTRLSPSDRASIAAFGTTTRVIVPFTNSKEDLLDGLDRLSKMAPAGMRYASEYRLEVQEAMRARRLSTREAIIRSWSAQTRTREKGTLEELRRAVAALGARAGKRVLLYVSDGLELRPGQSFAQALGPSLQEFAENVTAEFREVIAEANRVGVTIHALDAKGLLTDVDATESAPSPFSPFLVSQNLREALSGFADGTGGVLVTNRNTFGPGLDRIYRESSSYYSVGVTLKSLDPRVKEHKVEVTTTRPGVALRARRSVAPGTSADSARDRVEMALMNPGATGDFPASLTLGPPQKGGGMGHRVLTYEVTVPLDALTVREMGEKKVATLELSLAAVSDTGERSPVTTVRFSAEPRKEAVDGWKLTGSLKTGKGNFRFVAAVRDLATDRVAIASTAIRVE